MKRSPYDLSIKFEKWAIADRPLHRLNFSRYNPLNLFPHLDCCWNPQGGDVEYDYSSASFDWQVDSDLDLWDFCRYYGRPLIELLYRDRYCH
jgi:hypothetical protein